MSKSGLLLPVLLPLLLALLPAACASEVVPDKPSFEADIKPLTLSRCVRCHGGGGTLNADAHSVNPAFQSAPVNGFFAHPEEVVLDCMTSGTPPQPCHGLSYYAVGHPGEGLWTAYFSSMPPAPAAVLTDGERRLLNNWVSESPLLP